MARAMQTPADDTLPMTCVIESSQLTDGHGVSIGGVTLCLFSPCA